MTKATDVLDLYLKFMAGQRLTKLEIKDILENKSERTVQRYIADLNTFFKDKNKNKKIVMNQADKKYELIRGDNVSFDKEQLLAILKFLLLLVVYLKKKFSMLLLDSNNRFLMRIIKLLKRRLSLK